MKGYLELNLKSLTKKLENAVNKIVMGIKSSIKLTGKLTQFKVLNARVTEWPIVKDVTKTNIFFQSFQTYLITRAKINRI
jgi:cAMP phosphodiesterase